MKITIVGASGFIGRHVSAALRERGDAVTEVSLRDPAAAAAACEGADAVVNLAGAPVAQRWSAKVKAAIRSSRIDAPGVLLGGIAKLTKKPAAYISASAIGYYGTSDDATFTESSAPGSGFLAEVCVAWEATAKRAESLGMRVAYVRTGLVLGTDGGALAALLPLFRLGLGGIVASGTQWYSWVHIDDVVGLYLHALDGAEGPLNATAPVPVRNAEFTLALAHALHRPSLFPAPRFAIGLVLGEAATVVADGQRVVPERAEATGYRFRYRTIGDALTALFGA